MKGTSEVHLAHPPAIKQAYVPQGQTMEIILYLMFLDVKKKVNQKKKKKTLSNLLRL